MLSPDVLQVELFQSTREVLAGLGLLALVLIYNGYFFTEVLLFYRRRSANRNRASRFMETAGFIFCVLLLAFIQFGAVVIWSLALYLFGLIPNLTDAALFSGSCYTSMGMYSDNLPDGWRMLSLSIAFSGLFSFGWATAATVAMGNALTVFMEKK